MSIHFLKSTCIHNNHVYILFLWIENVNKECPFADHKRAGSSVSSVASPSKLLIRKPHSIIGVTCVAVALVLQGHWKALSFVFTLLLLPFFSVFWKDANENPIVKEKLEIRTMRAFVIYKVICCFKAFWNKNSKKIIYHYFLKSLNWIGYVEFSHQ